MNTVNNGYFKVCLERLFKLFDSAKIVFFLLACFSSQAYSIELIKIRENPSEQGRVLKIDVFIPFCPDEGVKPGSACYFTETTLKFIRLSDGKPFRFVMQGECYYFSAGKRSHCGNEWVSFHKTLPAGKYRVEATAEANYSECRDTCQVEEPTETVKRYGKKTAFITVEDTPLPPAPILAVKQNDDKIKLTITSKKGSTSFFAIHYCNINRCESSDWKFVSGYAPADRNSHTTPTLAIGTGKTFEYNNTYRFAVYALNKVGEWSKKHSLIQTLALTPPNQTPEVPDVAELQSSLLVKTGEPVTLNITATDPDGDALTVSAHYTKEGSTQASIKYAQRPNKIARPNKYVTNQWIPTKTGTYTYYVKSSDGKLSRQSATGTIQVTHGSPSIYISALSANCSKNNACHVGDHLKIGYKASTPSGRIDAVDLLFNGSVVKTHSSTSGLSANGTFEFPLPQSSGQSHHSMQVRVRVTQDGATINKLSNTRALYVKASHSPANPSGLTLHKHTSSAPLLPKQGGTFLLTHAYNTLLRWKGRPEANLYYIECKELIQNRACSSQNTRTTQGYWTSQSTSKLLEFKQDGLYQLSIRACATDFNHNELCQSSASPASTLTLKVTNRVPAPPTLTAPPESSGDYRLSWASNSGGVGETFQLQEKQGAFDAPGDWYVYAETQNTHFDVKQQPPGRYSYRLRVKNALGWSSATGIQKTVEVLPPVIRQTQFVVASSSHELTLTGVSLVAGARVTLVAQDNQNLRVTHRVAPHELRTQRQQVSWSKALPVDWQAAYNNGGITVEWTNPNGAQAHYFASKASEWRNATRASGGITLSQDGQHLYVANGRKITALFAKTGAPVPDWQFNGLGDIVAKPTVDGRNGHLLVGTKDARFYKVAKGNGSTLWQHRTHGEIVSSAVNDSDSNTYVGDLSGHLYSFNMANGKERLQWVYPAHSAITQSPSLSASSIYVTTEDGQIHTIGRGLLGPDILHWQSPANSALARHINEIHWQPDPKNLPAFLRAAHLYQLLIRNDLQGLPRDILTFWTFSLVQGASLDEAARAFLNANEGASKGLKVLNATAFVDHLYLRAWPTGERPPLALPEVTLSRAQLIELIQQGTPREHIVVYFIDALLGGDTGHNVHLLPLSEAFASLYDSNYRDFPFECPATDGDYYRLDCDNDGLPDWWEFTHFGDTHSQSGSSDADGDGQSNFIEWSADNSPCDAGCYDPIVAASMAPAAKPSVNAEELTVTDLSSTSAGQFRVNESGAATYNIPVSLPSGVAGVTPELSLNYSSQGGNGLLGRGWSLGGLSAIRRCRQTLGQDGVAKPITWTDQDRFCLDGQRLLVNNNVPYGHAGSTYTTEINAFAKVTAVGGSAGNPAYFKVERKDGSLSYYGRAQSSRQATAGGKTLTWSLSRFEDSVGNGIEYQYDSDNEQGHVLTEIRYAFSQVGHQGQQGGAPLAKVVLAYTTDRPDPMGGYVAGEHFATTRRLDKIQVFSSPSSEHPNLQELRTWQLHYPDFTTGFDRISQLQRITESRAGTQLPDTVFAWSNTSVGFKGLKDYFELKPEKYSWVQDYQPADINGDGRMDLVWLNPKNKSDHSKVIQHRVKYALATEEGFGYAHNVGADRHGAIDQGDRGFHSKMAMLDYNADGRSDLAYFDIGEGDGGRNPHWVVHLAKPLTLSNNDGAFEWGLSNTPIHTDITDSQTLFVDINSDGLVDAISANTYRLLSKNTSKTADPAQGYHFGQAQATTITGLDDLQFEWKPDNKLLIKPEGLPDEVVEMYLSPNVQSDFDGDGRADFLLYATFKDLYSYDPEGYTGYEIYYHVKAFVAFWRGDHLEVVAKPLMYVQQDIQDFGPNRDAAQYAEYRHAFIDQNISVADLNGDGASDLILSSLDRKTDTNHFTYRLGKGNGTFTEAAQLVSLPKKQLPQFVDYNLDGSTDLVYSNGGQLLVSRWFDGQLVADYPIKTGMGDARPTLMDMTGDGRLDLLLMNKDNNAISLYPAHNDGQSLNVVHTITNGLGAKTHIRYDTLADTPHYARRELASITEERCSLIEDEDDADDADDAYEGIPPRLVDHCRDVTLADENAFYAAIYGDWDFDVPSNMGSDVAPHNLGKLSPVLELMAPIQVVTAVSSHAPAANDDTPGSVNTENNSSILYFYEQAQVQAGGRGMLGFRRLRTLDKQSQVESSTVYRQDYPFTGYPLYTEKRTSAGDLISQSFNRWQLRGWNPDWPEQAATQGVKSLGALQPYIAESVEKVYDLTSGALIKTVTTNNQAPDAYGNAGRVTVATTDEINDETFTQTTTSQYKGSRITFANADHTLSSAAELGRLSYSKVRHTRPNQVAVDRTARFVYYTDAGSGGQPGQLKTEVVEPNNASLALSTTYQYDAFGNQTRVTQQGRDWSASGRGTMRTRTRQQMFDDAGRYPLKTLNAFGQVTEEVLSRNAYGSPLAVRDINGQVAKFVYTPMGAKVLEYSPTGAWSYTRRRDADDSYCPYTGVGYLMSEQTQADGGASFDCFDRLGRSVRTGGKTFDGRWSVVDTEYDDRGRVKRRSEPFALEGGSGAAEHWTDMTYDLLDRVVSTTLPGISAAATARYNGFTTTHKNPKGQTKTEVRNGLGELATVTDALGTVLSYDYDAQGNLTSVVTRGADGQTVKVDMAYDLLGRKTTLNDPDKGRWSYAYNAFGELRWQKDAKGQVTETQYDALGRQIWRENRLANRTPESRTLWEYNNDVWTLNDNTPANYGRGALLSVTEEISGYLKMITYDDLGRTSETHTSLPTERLLRDGLAVQGFLRTGIATNHAAAFGTDHYEKITYDALGRQHQVFDAAGDGTWVSQGIQNHYNAHGYLARVADAHQRNQTEHITYYQVHEMDLRGQIIEESHGNGVKTLRTYDPATGRLATQNSYDIEGASIQDQGYGWDDLGNLTWRQDQSGKGRWQKNLYESFTYDNSLNRLEFSSVGDTSTEVTYDSLGNITHKTGVGAYRYGRECGRQAGPHAVCSTDNGGVDYFYDANGNLTGDTANGGVGGRSIAYSTFDKPVRIQRGSHTTQFAYGPDRSRYLRTDVSGTSSKVTRYLGNVEKISHSDGRLEIKRYVGNAMITLKAASVTDMEALVRRPVTFGAVQYLLKDHLGSVDVVTDFASNVTEAMSFDAWGARRNALDMAQLLSFSTTRGFTGHEMLDEVGLVHMNGRIYDARIGRFVQADIQVQFPDDSQSYNRYSYAHNNPLKYTDSSGYGLDFFDAINIIGSVVLIVTGNAALVPKWSAFWAGAKTAHYGGDVGDIAKAAFSAYVMATAAPGSEFGAGQLAGYAILGGITSVLQGGKFGHGFISAGVGTLAGAGVGKIGHQLGPVGRVIAGALVGGTISEATGGKFANGAVSGAFSAAVREVGDKIHAGKGTPDNIDEQTMRPRALKKRISYSELYDDSGTLQEIILGGTVSVSTDFFSSNYMGKILSALNDGFFTYSYTDTAGVKHSLHIDFVAETSGRRGDIHFIRSRSASYAHVQGTGNTTVHVGSSSFYFNAQDIRHEVGHTLGFWHFENGNSNYMSYDAKENFSDYHLNLMEKYYYAE